jgi:hypothetical protein
MDKNTTGSTLMTRSTAERAFGKYAAKGDRVSSARTRIWIQHST